MLFRSLVEQARLDGYVATAFVRHADVAREALLAGLCDFPVERPRECVGVDATTAQRLEGEDHPYESTTATATAIASTPTPARASLLDWDAGCCASSALR